MSPAARLIETPHKTKRKRQAAGAFMSVIGRSGGVEDEMREIPFSIIYLDDGPRLWWQLLLAEAVDVDRIDGLHQPA